MTLLCCCKDWKDYEFRVESVLDLFQGCHTELSHTPGPWRAVQPWRLAEQGVSSAPCVWLSVVSPGLQPVNTDRRHWLGKTGTCMYVYDFILFFFS